jgi:predicted metal-binding protein
MSCMHCEHCQRLAAPMHEYMQRARRAALLIRLKRIIDNPQPTKVYFRRTRAKREADKPALARAA